MICDCNCPDEITLVKSHLEMQISIRPNFAKYFDPNKKITWNSKQTKNINLHTYSWFSFDIQMNMYFFVFGNDKNRIEFEQARSR